MGIPISSIARMISSAAVMRVCSASSSSAQPGCLLMIIRISSRCIDSSSSLCVTRHRDMIGKATDIGAKPVASPF